MTKMLRKLPRYILCTLLALMSLACSKTPDNVVNESDMVDLLVDLHKADAYVMLNSPTYNTDSLKQTVKQSVLAKHGVTPEEYDTSLVWYGHHVSVFNDVYGKVIEHLEKERDDLDRVAGKQSPDERYASHSDVKKPAMLYRAYGDTADVWDKQRSFRIAHNMGRAVLNFDHVGNKETKKGDRYMLRYKAINGKSSMNVYLAIDYKDGSTSLRQFRGSGEGWADFAIQGDSTREIRRMVGYLAVEPKTDEVIYVDSVQLIRTHLDKSSYSSFNIQKFYDRNGSNKKLDEDAKAKAEAAKGQGGTITWEGNDSKPAATEQMNPSAVPPPSLPMPPSARRRKGESRQ